MVLNLVYPEKSDIAFKIIRFPDGQQDIRCIPLPPEKQIGEVVIYSRMNSFADLELIIIAREILHDWGIEIVALYCPYFLGARSDRKFEDGSINYLKYVATPIINRLGFNEVTVIDPHSDVLEALIHNYNKISNASLVKWALNDIEENYVLISPDAGALKKIYDTAKEVGYNNEIIVASKHRDIKTGKILSTKVPGHDMYVNKDFVIIDDICDGGRTFIEIAKVIKSTFPDAKIYLIVTHGIFSAGLKELQKWFEIIYCTNSVKDIDEKYLLDQAVNWGILGEIVKEGFVKQLDIFNNV